FQNRKNVVPVKRLLLWLLALLIIIGMMVALLIMFNFVHKNRPAFIPFIFVGLCLLYFLAHYIIYSIREKVKNPCLTGILLVLLFIYLCFVEPDLEKTIIEGGSAVLIAMYNVFVFAFHFFCVYITARCIASSVESSQSSGSQPAPAAIPLQAVAAAPPAASVVTQNGAQNA
ncbi:hypothetical protein PMAYCL1PPCAC_07911, partial [Pristionchus mayeri]